MKVVVYNLGCKVNQYESDGILTKLANLGYEVADSLQYADCYILNTCAVTNEAEKKSRQAISRCLHFNKDAKIIVCGCASEHNSKQFEDKNGVTYISGVANKNKIPELLEQKGVFVAPISKFYEQELQPDLVRTRAYVKIQDGCNNFCSYCIIPYLRGRSRSRSMDSIIDECVRLQKVTNEIVLTGIDMSSYGLDIGTSLSELIKNLSHINVRIRFGSLEASVITEEFLQNTKMLKKFCPHFHLSLQSGDDNTLKSMNRKYTTAFYAEKVELVRQFYPTAAITTDLICGFPTESESEFENTLQ
ncbi:MAG: MiaB/RimO family radical SAM methylthiotransferase, partial [Clostridia bacterium]|nr:MiaB/RimO family radical SAM methylthiotransferase [Clostridia bacterium]